MIEIKLKFDDWSEARRVEDCLAICSQLYSLSAKDRGAMLDAAIQVREQLVKLMEKEDEK